MKFWYDSEFLEDGVTIDLISIAFVAEDGREYYAVNEDMDHERIREDKWLMKNVMAQLPDAETWKPKKQIAAEVLEFLTADGQEPELWAWYAAYDHVAYAQLWGKMIDLPKGLPMFTNDLRSMMNWVVPKHLHPELPKQPEGVHDALADARHLMTRYNWVIGFEAVCPFDCDRCHDEDCPCDRLGCAGSEA